jgi:putative transposase
VWAKDSVYIGMFASWSYLTLVLDLHSRAVVGSRKDASMQTSLLVDVLTIAVWRKKPKDSVIINSDQGI